jgi:hypothetical protein
MFLQKIILFWFIALLTSTLFAGSVPLAWDPSTSPNIAGYKVYVGTSSGNYGAPITIGNQTSYTVTGLTAGIKYFAVTAFNTAGEESGFSNEIFTIIPSGISSVTLAITWGPAITQLGVSALSPTSATIFWVTNADCSGTILYGTDPARLLALKVNNLGTTDHLGVVNGLIPRTHYFYKAQSTCGEKTIESESRSFNTK